MTRHTFISVEILLEAYKMGLFPMAESRSSPDIFWVDPDVRGVLNLNKVKLPVRFRRALKKRPFEIRIDTNFEQVIDFCASPSNKRADTWINEPIRNLYIELFYKGIAHSIECYNHNELIGGLYGVEMGGVFFGESMFSIMSKGSKVALAHLFDRLRIGGFLMLDTQFITGHLKQFGVQEVLKETFLKRLETSLQHNADFLTMSAPGFLEEDLYPPYPKKLFV